MKKELNLEELEQVTGGFGKKNCAFFVQALNKSSANKCENCRYYNKNSNGNYTCTHPLKTGDVQQSGVI